MHVSRFAGKTAPSEMAVSKQDAGISFQCSPANARRLIEIALSELSDLQAHSFASLVLGVSHCAGKTMSAFLAHL